MKNRIAVALAGSALAMSAWIVPASATDMVVANLVIESADSDLGYAMGPARSAAISNFAREAIGHPAAEDQLPPKETAAIGQEAPLAVPETPPAVSYEITGASTGPVEHASSEPEFALAPAALPDAAPVFESSRSATPVKRAAAPRTERKVVRVASETPRRRTVSLPVPVAIGVFR